uniref:C2H2-type domain-containing protein n=1 Tax=Salmo trutta TaxID=8032 RepID=A0A673YVW1_SALTR
MLSNEAFQRQLSTIVEVLVAAAVAEMGRLLDECSAAVMPLKLVQQNEESILLKSKLQRVNKTKTRQFSSFMEMLGKTLLEKMAMLMKMIMVEKEKTATGMSAQRRVSRARGTEEGAPRGDSLHFHNYCTDPVSESAHQEEDDFNPQTSPASETQDDQRNTLFYIYTSTTTMTLSVADVVLLSEFDHQEEVHLNPQLSPSSDTEKQDRQPSNMEPNPGRIGEDVQNGDSSNTDQNSDASDARAVKVPFICDFWGKYFNWRCTFKAHRNHHTKPFSCPQCGKGFGTKTGCNNHLLEVHSTDKPFKCTDCRKKFALRKGFVKHRDLNPTLHTCTTCVKSFCGERTLKRHNSLWQKLYVCNTCGKGFTRSTTLKIHQRKTDLLCILL